MSINYICSQCKLLSTKCHCDDLSYVEPEESKKERLSMTDFLWLHGKLEDEDRKKKFSKKIEEQVV
jgi:hypothetical protein